MAQGFSTNSTVNPAILYADSANMVSVSRVRTTGVKAIFGAKLTYDLRPLQYEQITNGTGATVTHDATNRQALMTFASTPTGGKSYMQTYQYFPSLPGRSQLIYLTFNMKETATDVLKFVGYSDGVNGLEFQANGSTLQFIKYSGSTIGNVTVAQSAWNVDKLDGTGASGVTLDITKVQVLVIDLIALYAGRVRMGFIIEGKIVYAHNFINVNALTSPYIQTSTLPVRCGMTSTATVSTTMNFICASVNTEGSGDDASAFANIFSTADISKTAGNGTRTHVMSLRPKTTFNSITNRYELEILKVNMMVTGSLPVFWELCIGQAVTSASYGDVNATYSATEIDSTGTISGSPTLVIASGYLDSSNNAKASISADSKIFYPLSLDQAGAIRANGTVTLVVTGIGGTSAMRSSIQFNEIK